MNQAPQKIGFVWSKGEYEGPGKGYRPAPREAWFYRWESNNVQRVCSACERDVDRGEEVWIGPDTGYVLCPGCKEAAAHLATAELCPTCGTPRI